MYLSGTRNGSSIGTWLNSRFIVMTIDEITFHRPKVSKHKLHRHLLVLPVETLPIHLEVLYWNRRSLHNVSRLRVVFRDLLSPPDNFAVPSATGKSEFISFVWNQFIIRVDSSGLYIWCLQTFFNLLSENVLSKVSPRPAQSLERFLLTLSCQIGRVLITLVLESGTKIDQLTDVKLLR